jgi:hypothetical protein
VQIDMPAVEEELNALDIDMDMQQLDQYTQFDINEKLGELPEIDGLKSQINELKSHEAVEALEEVKTATTWTRPLSSRSPSTSSL